jgi:hypothetical protein
LTLWLPEMERAELSEKTNRTISDEKIHTSARTLIGSLPEREVTVSVDAETGVMTVALARVPHVISLRHPCENRRLDLRKGLPSTSQQVGRNQ